MGSFKKFLHHVNIEDVKKKHLEEIAAKKLKEERQKKEKEFIVNTMKEIKYDWRSSLYEKMSTGTAFAYTASGQPDADVATIDASLETSFGHDQRGVEAHGYSPSGLMGGVAIKPSGSGTGSDGGFDIGDHLAFTGDTNYNVRWAALNPIDSTAIDTITITAIRGNDSNGGEDPDAEGEDLEVWYRNADMGQNMWTPINQDPAGNTISGVEKIIIPIGSDSSGLRDWTLPIPAHARTTSTQFMLFQGTSSSANHDHYGVTKISFKRNAPVNVVVSLDDPAASAFIRVGGPVGEKSDPKKRKKKVQDMLDASDEYVTKTMGENFPGTGVSLDPIEASPVGKDQVAKSFEKAGTPQKTIQQFLQTDDITGEPIEKKIEKSFSQFKPEVTPQGEPAPDPIPVNGNKNVVLGQDAQALETSADEDSAQKEAEREAAQAEKEAEMEVAQAEKEAEKEAELTDQEREELKNQGKTEEEIEAEEQKRYNDVEQKEVNKILDSLLDFAKQIDPLDMPIDLALDVAILIAKLGKGVHQFRSFLKKISGGKFGAGGPLGDPDERLDSSKFQKMINNIEIMRSNLTGRITTHNYTSSQINDLANSLDVSKFKGSNYYGNKSTAGDDGAYGISDQRYEYADDLIKVVGGKVERNDGQYRTTQPLANMYSGVTSIDGIGRGYGQMIIPSDGTTPYFYYYDYNYHNLNSPDAGEVPGLVNQIGSQVAQYLRLVLPGRIFDDVINKIQGNYDTFAENLKERVGLDGWPPGVHGATLTDFKINLSQLPQETQDMINAHPLSWTDERISKMTQDEIFQQFESASKDPGSNTWFNNNIIEILEKNHIELDDIMDQQSELYKKKYNITDQPEYFAAGDAAREYRDSIKENYKELIDNVEKEIPLPEGDYPKWDIENDPDIKANKEEIDKAWSTSQVKWDEAKPAMDAYSAHASTLELRGGYYYGTFQEIDKLKGLESKMNEKLAIWNRASDAWSALLDKEARLSTAYMNKLEKERKPWDDVYDKQREAKDKLYAERDKKVEAAQKAYEDTYINRGGGLVNGGDWKHPETGEVIPGMDTVKNNIQKEIDDLDKLAEPLFLGWYQDVLKQYKAWNWKTNYSGFGDGKSWTPKGGTSSGKGKGKSNPFQDRRTALSLDDPIVKDDDLYASHRLSGRNLFEKLKSSRHNNRHPVIDIEKIKKKYDYENKPSPDGFPENEPPQLDPKTGMHPRYGKNANRYGKLDPISAKAMARVKTGDPETDASVQKQAKKPK